MIRQLAILAVATICLAASTTAGPVTSETDAVTAQKQMYNFLSYIYQHKKLDPEIYEDVHNWTIEANSDSSDQKWQATINELASRFKLGMLPPGRIFSILYPHQSEEAVLLFKSFYHAPTRRDLMRIIYWAHSRINEYQFSYALNVALVYHSATNWIPVPQLYEIYPEFFFNSDIMKQVYDYKIGIVNSGKVTQDLDVHFIEANYSNWYITNTHDQEHKLAYFTEDIGANAWYNYFNMKYPFWMSTEEYGNLLVGVRGDVYYYVHKLVMNRYYLERLSHDLDAVEILDCKKPIKTGYSPYMTYPNGLHFPGRKEGSTVPIQMNEHLNKLEDFETRIADVIDSGYVLTKDGKLESIRTVEGINIIGNLIQGNEDSLNPDYYGSIDSLARHILGFSPEPHNYYQTLPSALEHFPTSLRDPAFYRLYTKIGSYFSGYKKHLDAYTKAELESKVIAIQSINIVENELFTWFEQAATSVDKFSYFNKNNVQRTTEIKVVQNRLNHSPFTYNITIKSGKKSKGIFRTFLGPKYDVYGEEISDNYKNFFEIDYFVRDLEEGLNTFERKSADAPWFGPDYIPSGTLERTVGGADLFTYIRSLAGFPGRLLLPRGKVEGLPLKFFFYVNEFVEDPNLKVEPLLKSRDNKPFGFPLDRPISNFDFPNMYFLDATVFHKEHYIPNLTTV